ncbi:hypothetical protein AB0H36_44335 [Kribbella sp. NPDC050820]|uniref:hypothetical protein n=1 Tax=Kribbella sp. NPDC050820 TaxID=3155408 RepID=UPI0033D104B1
MGRAYLAQLRVTALWPEANVVQACSAGSKAPSRSRSIQAQARPALEAPVRASSAEYDVEFVRSGLKVTPSSAWSSVAGPVVALATVALSSVASLPSRTSLRTDHADPYDAGASPKSSPVEARTEKASPDDEALKAGSFGCLVKNAVTSKVSLVATPFTRTEPQAAVAEASGPVTVLVLMQFGPASWLVAVIVSLVTVRLLPTPTLLRLRPAVVSFRIEWSSDWAVGLPLTVWVTAPPRPARWRTGLRTGWLNVIVTVPRSPQPPVDAQVPVFTMRSWAGVVRAIGGA